MEQFLAKQICRILDITYRQLDYWDRKRLVSPSVAQAQGSGSTRLYSLIDIRQLKVIKELKDRGISLQKIRKCLENLKDFFPGLEYPLIEKQLLTDGKTVYILAGNPDLNLDILTQKGQMVLFVPLKAWMEELKDIIARFEQQKKEEDKKQDEFYEWAEKIAADKGLRPMSPEEVAELIKKDRRKV